MAHDVLAKKLSLSLEEADEAAFAHLGEHLVEVTPISGGLLNSNFRVSGPTVDALMRVYPAVRSRQEIGFEISVLRALEGTACRTPRVLSGERVGTVADRPFILLEFLHGTSLEEGDLSAELARGAGEILAEFHKATAGFGGVAAKPRGDVAYVVDLLQETVESLAEEDGAVIQQAAKLVWDAVGGTAEWGAPDGVVHADFYVENLIRMEAGGLALVDFDDAYVGTTFFDVAIGAMEFSAREDQTLDPERYDAFVTAYRQARPDAPYPYERLRDAMLVNCLRFMCYTAPLTLDEGAALSENPYVRRIGALLDRTSEGAM